jgi:dipeptidyl-peptidase-4
VDAPDSETRRLKIGNAFVSVPDWEVRKVIGQLVSGGIVYLASKINDARETHVWISYPGNTKHVRLSRPEGVFGAEIGGDTIVVYGSIMADAPHIIEVLPGDSETGRISIKNLASPIPIMLQPKFYRAKVRPIDYSIIYPRDYQKDAPLPVLMDPYGGPWIQRCVKSSLSFTISQWFADQGFAVIVADGRGTPGRGRTWEKAVAGDLITKAVEDQIAALDDAVNGGAPLDIGRVAIRGWSFGGYLASLSVLLRPDRFHVAVAGAPVTDWRYYDTHYTERYLGNPDRNPEGYEKCSAISIAERLTRPLLLIHGLNDDNVVIGHTLRLSQALFSAGREHYVLPLTDIPHYMAASENATEHLLQFELAFIRNALEH